MAQLTRSQTDRKIAGVCGGLAEYFGVDSTLVRLIAVVLLLLGPGLLAYVVFWIVLPQGPESGPPRWGYGRESPSMRIAEDRFARGEIDADELQRIRRDLGEG